MFTAYFDAAGKSSRPGLLSIAGFVSDDRKWGRFEIEWLKILHRESISRFHMTDFASSQGEFKNWNGQTDRRKTLIADLLHCAKKFTNKAFGGAVVIRDYDEVNKDFELQRFAGHHYPLCAHYCVHLVQLWQKRHSIKEVQFVFEKGDEHKGELERLCKADGIAPHFRGKEAIQFQAADLVAWRTRDAFENAFKLGLNNERVNLLHKSFSEARSGPHQAFFGNRVSLVQFCIERSIPRRGPMKNSCASRTPSDDGAAP